MTAPADQHLLRQFCSTRSPDAFRHLVDRHLPTVRAAALRILRHTSPPLTQHADDVVQAVFILLFRRAHRVSEATPLAGWLYQATHHTCANLQRAERARRRRELACRSPAISPAPEPISGPLSDAEALLDPALHSLPAADRDILLLRYGQGLSVTGIALATASRPAAAKKRLHRALRKLRAFFAARGMIAAAPAALHHLAGSPSRPEHTTAILLAALSPRVPPPPSSLLAQGVSRMIFLTKLKLACAAALCLAAICAAPLLLAQSLSHGASASIAAVPATSPTVDGWVLIPAGQSTLPPIGLKDLIARVRTHAAKTHAFDVRYRVTTEQFPRTVRVTPTRTEEIPHVLTDETVREVRSADSAFFELTTMAGTQDMKRQLITYDGPLLSVLTTDPTGIQGLVRKRRPSEFAPTWPFYKFLPSALPRFLGFDNMGPPLPDPLVTLDDPHLQLSDARLRAGDHDCYVLESLITTADPVFTTGEQVRQWIAMHPGSKAIPVIDPHPQPPRRHSELLRIAIDPVAQYMPVYIRVARSSPAPEDVPEEMVPMQELRITRTRIQDSIAIPADLTLQEFTRDAPGHAALIFQMHLHVDRVVLNPPLGLATFAAAFDPGVPVFDEVRGISYTVGEPQESIDSKLAAAEKNSDFYRELLGKAPPPLSADQWINTRPLTPADFHGHPVALHFWSIHCAPCIAEIPRLQQAYEDALALHQPPPFIAIHAACDAEDLDRLHAFIAEKKITFPLLIDAPDPTHTSWGLTAKAYGIYGLPNDARIDAGGILRAVGHFQLP
jgi:RNA polymerase sigma-70 factor (ECF subfamily)